jgi:hypothetical protein
MYIYSIDLIPLWYLTSLSTIFQYILSVSFIGGGNRGKHRPVASCWQTLSQFGYVVLHLNDLHLHHSGQFYLWMKPEYPEKTIDLLQVTDKSLSHNVVSSTLYPERYFSKLIERRHATWTSPNNAYSWFGCRHFIRLTLQFFFHLWKKYVLTNWFVTTSKLN